MISLIIPIYNVREYLEEFLESVVNQTFKDFEALLIDDGSNDGSEKIIDEYAKKYFNFRVIHKANEGLVLTWKRGVKEANGEYIAFADPDDILKPDMLETLNRLMVENNADLVISGITRLENGEFRPMSADNWNLADGLYTGDKLKNIKINLFGNKKVRKNVFFFARWNKLFKKEVLLKNLSFSNDTLKFGDDVCCSASAIYDCERLYYISKPLYIYRIRSDSLTTVIFNKAQIDNALTLINSVRKLLNDKGYMNDFIYYNDPSYHIIWLMRKIKACNVSKNEKKQLLEFLKQHEFVKRYNLKGAKKYISFRRYMVIWLLKHSMYSLLIKLL